MKQYNQIKARHPEAMLLFRVGDFYETFGADAVKASRILGIILTKRKNGAAAEMELAGVSTSFFRNIFTQVGSGWAARRYLRSARGSQNDQNHRKKRGY